MNRRLLELLWMPWFFVPLFLLLLTARALILNGALGYIANAIRIAFEAVVWFLTGGVPSLGDSLMIAWVLFWLTFMWLLAFANISLGRRRDRGPNSRADRAKRRMPKSSYGRSPRSAVPHRFRSRKR
jgi:hypothetical protein